MYKITILMESGEGMTREEMKELKGLAASMGLYDDKNPCKRAVILGKAIKLLEQEFCEDCVSRQAVLELVADYDLSMGQVVRGIHALPSVNPQEPSITWVTGVDGAKIAFWDVPVWKVTKICEILGEQEVEE